MLFAVVKLDVAFSMVEIAQLKKYTQKSRKSIQKLRSMFKCQACSSFVSAI